MKGHGGSDGQRCHNRVYGFLVAVICLTLFSPMYAPLVSQALGGNCSASLKNAVASTWAEGSCKSLNRDTKAQITLDLAFAPDYHTNWFTDTRVHKTGSSHFGVYECLREWGLGF
ncbi:hypothetical protein, partial [Alloscardovia macacae]|uniref:hypothetical protein n=1 Tax=Alloscardovia macacae TaxID=1160091 RepID=UPI001C5B4710